MIHPLVEYFRCPKHLAVLGTGEGLSGRGGLLQIRRRDRLRTPVGGGAVAAGERKPRRRVPRRVVERRPGAPAVRPRRSPSATCGTSDIPEARCSRVDRRSPPPSITRAVYYSLRPAPAGRRPEAPPATALEGMADASPFPRWPVDVVGRDPSCGTPSASRSRAADTGSSRSSGSGRTARPAA